ncbi:MAG TPA: PepSY domain-containing protein [Rhizomicrobium sp.]|nr:PepSY domain-containing protein [Rhizomicrobium sp.]
MEQKLILLSLTAAVSLSLATGAFGYTGENLASGAKLTMTKASDIAVKARPGKITDRELEQEKGGSGLRYSFDVQAKGVTWEVGVDAVTGKVLENDREGKNPD